jgi:hypothetical protein
MPSTTRLIYFKEVQQRWELSASPSFFHVDGNGMCTGAIGVALYSVKGTKRTEVDGVGVTVSCDDETIGNFTLPLSIIPSNYGNDEHHLYVSNYLKESPKFFTVSGVNGSNDLQIPVIYDGIPGQKGEKGAVLRGPQAWSDLPDGYNFYAGAEGEEIKDVVLYNGSYFSCIKTHTKSATNYPTSPEDTANGYWFAAKPIEIVATKILLSQYALVKNLGVEAIDMKDGNGNIIFQAKGGEVTCNKGTFKNIKVIGSIRNPFSLANDSIDTNYSDNVAMLTNDGGWLTSYSMPWDVSQSGRRLSIVNYKWGSTLASGKAVINAPSGKYFFEDGIQKSKLVVSRETIELIGYGTTTEFYGWIVLNRIDLATSQKYGHCLKALAVGTVSGGDSNNNTSITSSTFDGSELTVSRQSQGLYRVYYPSAWFSDLNYCHVMLTGRGVCYKDNGPVKATLHSLGNGYFDVTISDDATRNDGSFDFIIYNGSDFDILK